MAITTHYDATGDRELRKKCYTAITADAVNTPALWAVDDIITLVENINTIPIPEEVVNTFWVNTTTGVRIDDENGETEPVIGTDVVPCPNGSTTDVELTRLYDTDTASPINTAGNTRGQVVMFIRSQVYDLETGQAIAGSVYDFDPITGAAYTVFAGGTVYHKPTRVAVGDNSGSIATATQTADATLTPTNAHVNHVELHVFESSIIFTTTGTTPDPATFVGRRHNDGSHPELQSRDEISNFKARSMTTTDAKIYAEFYNFQSHN